MVSPPSHIDLQSRVEANEGLTTEINMRLDVTNAKVEALEKINQGKTKSKKKNELVFSQ